VGEIPVGNTPENDVQVGIQVGRLVLDSIPGKSGAIPVGHISIQRRNGAIHGYTVYLGVDGTGNRVRRFFPDLTDAKRYLDQHDNTPIPIGELWERKAEILYALERLRPYGTNLVEVVSYYLEQRSSSFGKRMFGEVVEEFLHEKRQVGRSEGYGRNLRKCFHRFISQTGGDREIGTITRSVLTDYVYRKHEHLSNVSKKNLLTNFSVLLNFAVKRDYLQNNPVEKIDRPTIPFVKPSVMVPDDFAKLLGHCFRKNWHDRLVLFVLVGFVGIRVEEASRLKWSNLDLIRGVVEVPASVAKKASFRNNVIPPNALSWLRMVHDQRRTGPLTGPRWSNHLRSAITSTKIPYTKNCIRHSFCSYALASRMWSLSDVVQMMGHGGSTTMVFSHYRNVVSEEDGKKWFGIVPEVS
jgi:site-specific recombinase XerD